MAKRKILRVKLLRETDIYPDTDWIGKFSDKPNEFAIIVATGKFLQHHPQGKEVHRDRDSYRYFNPNFEN